MDISLSQEPDFSVLNNSKSKQSYSFARNDRFKELYSRKILPVGYDVPQIKDNRTCTFGKGKKFDFFQLVKKNQPSPSAYSLKSEFIKPDGIAIYKGASFGTPRSQIIPRGNENPGPAHYQASSTLSKVGVSIISRHDQSLPSYVNAPGPGSYNPKDLFPTNGKFVQSTFQNVVSGKIYSSTDRFKLPHGYLSTPAPAYYYNQEKQKKEIGYSFGSGKRSEIIITHMKESLIHLIFTPGPGKYGLPSDFVSKKLQNLNLSQEINKIEESEKQESKKKIEEPVKKQKKEMNKVSTNEQKQIETKEQQDNWLQDKQQN